MSTSQNSGLQWTERKRNTGEHGNIYFSLNWKYDASIIAGLQELPVISHTLRSKL